MKLINQNFSEFTSLELELFFKLKDRAVSLLTDIFKNGLRNEELSLAVTLADDIVDFVSNERFPEIIKTYKSYTPYAFTHPFLSAVFSVAVGRKLEWNSSKTLMALPLGALLQDIGMRMLPEDVLGLTEGEMTPAQLEAYRQHPAHSLEMISAHASIPASVQQIVFQHHECQGSGFPHGLSSIKTYNLAKVVCLSERFVRLLMDKDLLPVDGIRELVAQKNEIMKHDPDIVRALIRSFIKEQRV